MANAFSFCIKRLSLLDFMIPISVFFDVSFADNAQGIIYLSGFHPAGVYLVLMVLICCVVLTDGMLLWIGVCMYMFFSCHY